MNVCFDRFVWLKSFPFVGAMRGIVVVESVYDNVYVFGRCVLRCIGGDFLSPRRYQLLEDFV